MPEADATTPSTATPGLVSVVLAFIGAPLPPTLLLTAVSTAFLFHHHNPGEILGDILAFMWSVGLPVLLYAYIVTLALGAPIYLLLGRRLALRNGTASWTGAIIASTPIGGLLFFFLRGSKDDGWIAIYVGLAVVLGALGGLMFVCIAKLKLPGRSRRLP